MVLNKHTQKLVKALATPTKFKKGANIMFYTDMDSSPLYETSQRGWNYARYQQGNLRTFKARSDVNSLYANRPNVGLDALEVGTVHEGTILYPLTIMLDSRSTRRYYLLKLRGREDMLAVEEFCIEEMNEKSWTARP